MREIVHLQAGQCGNQIGAKVTKFCYLFIVFYYILFYFIWNLNFKFCVVTLGVWYLPNFVSNHKP